MTTTLRSTFLDNKATTYDLTQFYWNAENPFFSFVTKRYTNEGQEINTFRARCNAKKNVSRLVRYLLRITPRNQAYGSVLQHSTPKNEFYYSLGFDHVVRVNKVTGDTIRVTLNTKHGKELLRAMLPSTT